LTHVNSNLQQPNYCTGSDSILIDDLESTILKWRELGGTDILHVSPTQTLAELKQLGGFITVYSYFTPGFSW